MMKTFKLIHFFIVPPLLAMVLHGAIAAQEEGETAESKGMTTPEYDRYWGDGDNPDMSSKAMELTHPDEVYLEENGYIVAECEDQAFNDNWKLMKDPEGFLGCLGYNNAAVQKS